MTGPAPTIQSGEPLVTVADVKAYLRIQHTLADDDLKLEVEQAEAILEGEIQRPIKSRVFTVQDVAQTTTPTTTGRDISRAPIFKLVFPFTPMSTDPDDTEVTDKDGVVVDPTTYYVEWETGIIYANEGSNGFSNGPYTIDASVGMEYRSDYEQQILPALKRVIIEIVAILYQQKNPAAMQESQGGGRSTQYSQSHWPPRTQGFINRYSAVPL